MDCFESATERDIYTGRITILFDFERETKKQLIFGWNCLGDKLEIVVLRKNQEPQVSYFNLRRDWERIVLKIEEKEEIQEDFWRIRSGVVFANLE